MKAWTGLGAGGRAVFVATGIGALAAGGTWLAGLWPAANAPEQPVALLSTSVTAGAQGGAQTPPDAAPDAQVAAGTPAGEPNADASADQGAAEAAAAAEAEAEAEGGVPLETSGDTPGESVDVAAPVITTWLVTPAGHATIGGFGVPGSRILVMLDGAEIGAASVTQGGEFALITRFAANPQPSVLSLVMVLPDGSRIPSDERIALGPIAGEPAPATPRAEETSPEPGLPGTALADSSAQPAADPPVALKISEEGVTLLQPPAADPGRTGADADFAPVMVHTISYGSPEQVQIGGGGQPGSWVRLYLDMQPVGPAEISVSGAGLWQTDLEGIAPGLYTLRVDQLDAEGRVTSRYETPFRRETPETLAMMVARPAAASGADGIAVPPADPAADPVLQSAAPDLLPADAANAPDGAMPGSAPAVSITVQPGNTLWAIAREEFGEGVLYVQLYEANRDRIRDPDLIYPGQVFKMPER